MKKKGFSLGVLLLFLLGLAWSGEAAGLKKYFSLYGTYLNYGNSKVKEDGYAVTAYGSLGDGKHHGVEVGLSQMHLNYESGYSDLDQTDFTLAYTNTGSLHPNFSFRLGGHYISSDDDLTDEGLILVGDLTYFVPYRWNVGLEASYSDYDELVDFEVFQAVPHAGRYFSFAKGKVYLEARGYYIHVSDSDRIGISLENYYSLEASATYLQGPWSLKLSGWAGQQIFAVKNAGFVVYNLREKYRGGITGEITYRLRQYLLGANLTWNTYKEVESDNTVNQAIFTVFVGLNF